MSMARCLIRCRRFRLLPIAFWSRPVCTRFQHRSCGPHSTKACDRCFRRQLPCNRYPCPPEIATRLESEYLDLYMKRWLSAAPLYAHLPDALATLRTLGLTLGICTNRDRASTEVLLAQAGITGVFDVIVGMGDAPHPKPAADPLLMVLQKMGLSAEQTLFVGDSYMDASCARLSHVRFAAHLGGYAGQPNDLLPNIWSFTGYDEFTSWMLRRQSSTQKLCHA
jgi:phosphoglycolate phosphatase